MRRADTTKTEPEYLDNATEILVRGRLLVEGTEERPVLFEPLPGEGAAGEEEPGWGGIIFDGGEGSVRHCRVAGAETGITLLDSSPLLDGVAVEGGRTGIAVHRGSSPRLVRVRAFAAETGIACWAGSAPALDGVDARGAEHEGLLAAPGAALAIRASAFRGGVADVLWGAEAAPPADLGGRIRRVAMPPPAARELPPLPFTPRVPPAPAAPDRAYRGESFIGEDTTWAGEILVDGTVMVSPAARLTVAPGTVVRFAFRDSDGDGVGESELFVQGRLVAEGTAAAPIVFTALDGAGPGRWGAINVMGADAEESTLAWCLIEHSFRGLHGHFSRFRVERSVFRDNRRAVQFQESTVALAGCALLDGGSALRFRDSTVALEGLLVAGNALGIQALRSSFTLAGSTIAANALSGLHVRECEGSVAGCLVAGNGPGLRVSDARLRIEGNRIEGNGGGGLLLRRTEARVEGNRIAANAGNGVSTDSPGARLRGNAVTGSLRFAVENNAAEPVEATGNWWGAAEPPPALFFDRADDPRLGPVLRDPALAADPTTFP